MAQGAMEASVVVLQFVTSSSVLLGCPGGGPEAALEPLRLSPGSLPWPAAALCIDLCSAQASGASSHWRNVDPKKA